MQMYSTVHVTKMILQILFMFENLFMTLKLYVLFKHHKHVNVQYQDDTAQ